MRHRTRLPFNGLIIIVLLFFFSSLAFATADGPDYLDVRDIAPNDELTIHLKPADTSELVGKIPHNATCLKNMGCRDDNGWWCKIVYQQTIGWVNSRFLKEGGDCSSSFGRDTPERSPISSPEVFTKQLIDGKILYNQDKNAFVKLSFQKSNVKSFDGTIVFTFLKTKDCLPGTIESLPYRLKEGKIIYYANDGSKTRLTLQAITSTSWMVLEEEDIDGDDPKFDFRQSVKKVYDLKSDCERTQLDYSPN